MSFRGYKPYVSVAQRQAKATAQVKKAQKTGISLSPIEAKRGAIATTFWGKAWCDNLESYSDYENRLPRGRTYVRNGSVIDLKLDATLILAQVMGSSLYRVTVKVAPVSAHQWAAIGKACSGSIDSLVELLQGKLSTGVMQCICAPKTGLFPTPKELSFACSCPDWAGMCKHVAAVMYGVGARLDRQPELLFALRGVDAKDLVGQAGAGLSKPVEGVAASRMLDDSALADVFGFEMDEEAVLAPANPVAKKAAVKKVAVKNVAVKEASVKKAAVKKVIAEKTTPKKAVPKKAVATPAVEQPIAEPVKAAVKSAATKTRPGSAPSRK